MKQYIGARYVPILFNNNGSNEWIANYHYEPLTIVTYNMVSYTSSKDVPATVGNPAENPDYWVATGNFNGFIGQLQNDIVQLQNNIMGVTHKKKYIIIGDSYVFRNNYLLSNTVAQIMGLNSNELYVAAQGGARWKGDEPLYLSLLQSLNITNPEEITDILVLGGVNDITIDNPQQIVEAMQRFSAYVSQTYPNAYIHVGFISRYKNVENQKNMITSLLYSYEYTGANNMGFIEGSYNYTPFYLLEADGIHPTVEGTRRIAYSIVDYLKGYSSNSAHFSFLTIPVTAVEGTTLTAEPFTINGVGLNKEISWNNFDVKFTDAVDLWSGIPLLNFSQNYINAWNYKFGGVTIPSLCILSGTYTTIPVTLQITPTGINIQGMHESNKTVSRIWIPAGSFLLSNITT